MSHKLEIEGQEVDVFTTEEVAAREAAARAAVEGEWKPKYETAEQERVRTQGILEARTKEFGQAREGFKRLSDEQYAKLEEKDKIIYDNQLTIHSNNEKIAESDKKTKESAIDSAIRVKVGGDATLFAKVKDMYALVNLEDVTPEQMQIRVNAALGAVGTTSPDLLAAAGFGGGSFEPPRRDEGSTSFADTERGKDLAKSLGILIEEPKK